jgi:hypothetical protein
MWATNFLNIELRCYNLALRSLTSISELHHSVFQYHMALRGFSGTICKSSKTNACPISVITPQEYVTSIFPLDVTATPRDLTIRIMVKKKQSAIRGKSQKMSPSCWISHANSQLPNMYWNQGQRWEHVSRLQALR